MFIFAKKFRKFDVFELLSIICSIFHTSVRYQMFIYVFVENLKTHLSVKKLEQTTETRWRKTKNKSWPISSGPPDIFYSFFYQVTSYFWHGNICSKWIVWVELYCQWRVQWPLCLFSSFCHISFEKCMNTLYLIKVNIQPKQSEKNLVDNE